MSKARLTAVTCALAIAITAIAAASAGAAGWYVNGRLLSGSAALSETARVVGSKTSLEGGGLKIECIGEHLNLAAPKLESPNKGSASSVEFTDCVGVGSCSLTGTTVKTEPLSFEAELSGSDAARVTFKPTTGTLFASVKFQGEECATPGKTPVTGKVTTEAATGQEGAELHTLKSLATAGSGELKLGSSTATLEAEAELSLASEENWGFGAHEGLDEFDGGNGNLEKNDEEDKEIVATIPGVPFVNVVVGAANLMYLTAPEGYTEAFKIVKNTCEGLIKAFTECGIEISFKPKGKGRYLSDLLVPVKEDGGVFEEVQRVMLIYNA